MSFFLSICIFILTIYFIILILRAIFVAFIKKKDERSKWIVTKSMADSFIINIILQAILMAIKYSNYERFQVWWENFKEELLYIEPVALSFMILGVVLIINTKKHGGSL